MSTDKFKDVFPNPPSFVAGEQPKGLKYSRWSAQTDEGMRQLESAVGNLWASFQINNDPYPVLLTNLTRGIGSIDYINPYIPRDIEVDDHEQDTPAGVREMVLELLPNPDSDPWDFMVASADTAIVVGDGDPGYQPSRAQLAIDGDWTYENRRLYTFQALDGNQTIQYNGQTGDGDLGIGFAVMPNLSQITGVDNTACGVTAWVDGGGETYYVVTMPFLLKDKLLPGETSPQEPQVGTDVQLELPVQARPPTNLVDDEIPPGLIALWDAGDPIDLTAATPISADAQYYAVSATEFIIRGVELEGVTLPSPPPDDFGPTNNTRYFLVTMGVSLAEAVGHLQKRFLQHDHSSGEFVAPLAHGNLIELIMTDGGLSGGGQTAKNYAVASTFDNNDHPMYLFREGYQALDKGTYYNAMVGDLCLASSVEGVDGYHRNVEDDSRKLTFYHDTGPMVYYDIVLDRLVFRSFSIAGGVEGGFQFGHSLDGPNPGADPLQQARFLGPVEIQNTLEADLPVTFHDTLDVEDLATLDRLDVTNDAVVGDTLDVGALATLASLLVTGTWQTDGAGTINEDVTVLAGKKIDEVDISEHYHAGGTHGGKAIPVEGIDRVGDNGTPVRINAAGYAVYAP